jgi:hypothetical protein
MGAELGWDPRRVAAEVDRFQREADAEGVAADPGEGGGRH